MTTAQLNTLRSQALGLEEAERAKLASDLVASLDGPLDVGSERAWDIEICRRINEVEAGKADSFEMSEVLSKARSRIAAQ